MLDWLVYCCKGLMIWDFALNGRDGSEMDETYTGSNGSLSLVNVGRGSMLLLFLSPGDYMFF
jgi:hypothetical protein